MTGPDPRLSPARARDLLVQRVPFEAIPRASWDALLAVTARPTPFSRWTFQRAWWDAYGDSAREHYLVLCRPHDDRISAIVPLMTRGDTLYLGATYHADYATILCDPADLPEVTEALARQLAHEPVDTWAVADLRRLRHDDPVLEATAAALRAAGADWRVEVSQEDVCPVVTLPASGDWEEYLATLDRKARHEIRRKIRRAETVGPLEYRSLPLDAASADRFIGLHQARWGDRGLFPDTPDGDRSRRFLHRLTELEADEGPGAQLQFGEARVGERTLILTVGFDDGETVSYYNVGMDPAARELSPGVTGTAAYIRDRMAAGRRRFDFLRGDEAYKYEWGARDEPIGRIVVTRA